MSNFQVIMQDNLRKRENITSLSSLYQFVINERLENSLKSKCSWIRLENKQNIFWKIFFTPNKIKFFEINFGNKFIP